jgi:hypothetical protein
VTSLSLSVYVCVRERAVTVHRTSTRACRGATLTLAAAVCVVVVVVVVRVQRKKKGDRSPSPVASPFFAGTPLNRGGGASPASASHADSRPGSAAPPALPTAGGVDELGVLGLRKTPRGSHVVLSDLAQLSSPAVIHVPSDGARLAHRDGRVTVAPSIDGSRNADERSDDDSAEEAAQAAQAECECRHRCRAVARVTRSWRALLAVVTSCWIDFDFEVAPSVSLQRW